MNDCKACGGRVRLGAVRVTANRQRGVLNYVAHMKATDCKATKGFECIGWKADKTKPRPCELLVKRWNEANPENSAITVLV